MACKVPECSAAVIHLRGLCRSCYLYASSLVFHKLVTWKQLEASGCIAAATGQVQSPKRPQRTIWFARGAGMTPEALSEELRRRSKAYTITLGRVRKKRQRKEQ